MAGSDKSTERDGCGYLLATCLATCFLLAANGVFVAMAYDWLRIQGFWATGHQKLVQTLLFLGPVLLIFVEWWLIDLLAGYRSLRRRRGEREEDL